MTSSSKEKFKYPLVGLSLTVIIFSGSLSILLYLYNFGVFSQEDDLIALLKESRAISTFWISFKQATLSCIISFCLAIPIASTISRYHEWYIVSVLFAILGLVLVMPTTVAAVGILKVFGLNGWIANSLDYLSSGRLGWINVYGMHGLILAHVFFNLPLMVRVFVPIFLSFPKEHIFLGEQFQFSRLKYFWILEWPSIKKAAMSVNLLVFMLCFTSFSLVLMLGGGPKVTTFEVEIYSALRFDFNISKASVLALIQVLFVMSVVFALAFTGNGLSNNSQIYTPLGEKHKFYSKKVWRVSDKSNKNSLWSTLIDVIWLSPIVFIILFPFLAVLFSGFSESIFNVLSWQIFWVSFFNTLLIAFSSALLAITFGLILIHAKVKFTTQNLSGKNFFIGFIETSVLIYLAIPAIVLGTGLFVIFRQFVDVMALSWLILIMANVFLSLPFVVGLIEPKMVGLELKYKNLLGVMEIKGVKKFLAIILPGISFELGLALGLALCFSIGDLSVIALFGNNDFQTIPWLIYQTYGRYGLSDANALALILLVITFFFFFISQILVRKLCITLAKEVRLNA